MFSEHPLVSCMQNRLQFENKLSLHIKKKHFVTPDMNNIASNQTITDHAHTEHGNAELNTRLEISDDNDPFKIEYYKHIKIVKDKSNDYE